MITNKCLDSKPTNKVNFYVENGILSRGKIYLETCQVLKTWQVSKTRQVFAKVLSW